MKVLKFFGLFVTLIMLSLPILSQNTCKEFDALKEAGKELLARKNIPFKDALNKFNAAKLCDPSRAPEIDTLVFKLFQKIEDKKIEAERNEKKARRLEIIAQKNADSAQKSLKQRDIALAEVQEQKNDALALFWSSESENFNPIQALRVNEYALSNTDNIKIQPILKRKMVEIFNRSSTHKFNEKYRATGELIAKSSDNQWMLSYVDEGEVGEFRFLKFSDGVLKEVMRKSGNLENAFFSKNNQWLLTLHGTNGYRLWQLSNGFWVEEMQDTSIIEGAHFSSDNQWLLTRLSRDNGKGAIRMMQLSNNEKHEVELDTSYAISATFSPDNKWLLILYGRNRTGNGGYGLWKFLNGKWNRVKTEEDYFAGAAFSADNKWLLTRSADRQRSVHLWTLQNDTLSEVKLDSNFVTSASFSKDKSDPLAY